MQHVRASANSGTTRGTDPVTPFPERVDAATLTRDERIERMEAEGRLHPACPGCQVFYQHPTLSPFAPAHKALSSCRSGGRNHCTCDGCF